MVAAHKTSDGCGGRGKRRFTSGSEMPLGLRGCIQLKWGCLARRSAGKEEVRWCAELAEVAGGKKEGGRRLI